jgi:hypothetical protein
MNFQIYCNKKIKNNKTQEPYTEQDKLNIIPPRISKHNFLITIKVT